MTPFLSKPFKLQELEDDRTAKAIVEKIGDFLQNNTYKQSEMVEAVKKVLSKVDRKDIKDKIQMLLECKYPNIKWLKEKESK